ncbi:hypothetical protein [Streptomyces werraensis]|uniref:hypothetical protein n=1 Tax=Streptomyces werraensis TaxID=68284 RepID=UPI001CE3AAC0
MSEAQRTRLRAFLAMSAAQLRRPLWQFAPADAGLVLIARRRVLGADPEDAPHVLRERDERVTDWAPTE